MDSLANFYVCRTVQHVRCSEAWIFNYRREWCSRRLMKMLTNAEIAMTFSLLAQLNPHPTGFNAEVRVGYLGSMRTA